jgi:hypothetical protein
MATIAGKHEDRLNRRPRFQRSQLQRLPQIWLPSNWPRRPQSQKRRRQQPRHRPRRTIPERWAWRRFGLSPDFAC